jgi:hypothetical protein
MPMMIIAKSLHPYTLASRTSQNASQNLPKSMAAQPHRQTADRKHGHTTSCIVHLADSVNFKGVTTNKLCNGSIDSCFESPNDTIHATVGSKQNHTTLKININKVTVYGDKNKL